MIPNQDNKEKELYFKCISCGHTEKDFVSLEATQVFSKEDNSLEWTWHCKLCFQPYSMPAQGVIKLPFKQYRV